MNAHSSTTDTILIAEDDDDDFFLLKRNFRQRYPRLAIERVRHGEEAMLFLRTQPSPTIIVLDLNMPRKDGREVLEEIKADSSLSEIPVVVFTTSNYDQDRQFVLQKGAIFFPKPYEIGNYAAFMDVFDNYLDKGEEAHE